MGTSHTPLEAQAEDEEAAVGGSDPVDPGALSTGMEGSTGQQATKARASLPESPPPLEAIDQGDGATVPTALLALGDYGSEDDAEDSGEEHTALEG